MIDFTELCTSLS